MISFIQKLFFILGSILAFLSVAAGAFGAHALKQKLPIESLTIYETAARYQMYHALALILVAFTLQFFYSFWFLTSGWCFLVGILLFSGSLYLLVFSGVKSWGMVTPIGGLFFLLGWLFFCFACIRE